MAEVDYSELKKGGFMRQRQKNRFSLRLRIVGGQVTAEQIRKAGEVAERFGQGYIHLTSRQGIEIPFIALEDIEKVKNELAEAGLEPGACGARVRTITACQGSSICPSGLIETNRLAQELDKAYFGLDLPHKFKIGITGCRNNCLKAEENDLGIKGGLLPRWTESQCSFCGLCQAVCPSKAIAVEKEERRLHFAETDCVYCGKCVKSCGTGAWEGESGYLVSFGGMFGNHIARGERLVPILFSKEQLTAVIDATLEFYKRTGKRGERFGLTLSRVGSDALKPYLEGALSHEPAL